MTIGHDPPLLVQRDYPWGPSRQNGGLRLPCRVLQGQNVNGPTVLPCEVDRIGQGPVRVPHGN